MSIHVSVAEELRAGPVSPSLIREGRNESEAIRTALAEAGQRRLRHAGLAAEVQRLTDDAADSAEREAVMADMQSLSADWPE
jgi:Arc/MetJ-type ribon-helix-helix transcriptional regulator